MRALLTLTLLAVTTLALGQLQQVHTFDQATSVRQLSKNEQIWLAQDDATVTLYNADFSLLQSITIPEKEGYKIVTKASFSRTVFDDDNGIEYTVAYLKEGGTEYVMDLIDDNGQVIQSFDNATSFVLTSVGGKAMAYYTEIGTQKTHVFEINELPYSAAIDGPENQGSIKAYPNPATESVALSYELPNGQNSGQIRIHNLEGQQVHTVPVGRHFNTIQLPVSQLPAGVYVYSLDGANPQKLVIE